MERIERLYWEIDPERNYPLDFITYQITRFPPGNTETTALVGEATRKDLLLMVERLSESLEDAAADYDPKPYDLAGLRRRLGVTAKTISRYRRDGLFARRLVFPNGRVRLAFPPASVERFLESRRTGGAKQSASFSRIDEPTRHRIITRARRIASRANATPFTVARHLAPKYRRSTEAVRRLLIRHDREDPRVAIFPRHTPPLSEKQQRVIHRAYHRGVPIARLARRYHKARSAIYVAINRRRAAALQQLDLRYVSMPTFELPDAEAVILGTEPSWAMEHRDSLDAAKDRPSAAEPDALAAHLNQAAGEPLPDAATERAMFARFNYLKFRAARLREGLDRHHPRAGRLDQIETYLRRAVVCKHQLVRSYLRVVIEVARRHQDSRSSDPRTPRKRKRAKADGGRLRKRSRSARPKEQTKTETRERTDGFDPDVLAQRVEEGHLVLLESIQTFDPKRGSHFSTYLSWRLMRRFARAAGTGEPPRTERTLVSRGEYWPASLNPNLAAVGHAGRLTRSLIRLLDELDERERWIIAHRFGLEGGRGRIAQPRTLAEVAAELEITPERARQIEHRTIRKLRRTAARLDLPPPSFDAPPVPYGGFDAERTKNQKHEPGDQDG